MLNDEETSFSKTLDRGEKLFADTLLRTRDAGSNLISGSDAWRLYDTYGFPIDLTRLMAAENGMHVDEAGFEVCQTQAKEISRGGVDKAKDEIVALDVHIIAEIEKRGIKPTDDSFKYQKKDINAQALILLLEGKLTDSVSFSNGKKSFGIVLDKTNFYAEQGGQTFDTGSLFSDGKFDFHVQDCQVFGGYVLHIGYLKYGKIDSKDLLTCSYDEVLNFFNSSYAVALFAAIIRRHIY